MALREDEFPHIVSHPGILGGKPCIKGTRISVQLLLEMVAGGASIDSLLYDYPELSKEQIQEAFRYAAHSLGNAAVAGVPVEA